MTAPMQPLADPALVKQLTAGDERALSLVYDCYSAMLFGMLMRILNNKQTAEEVLQDIFMQLWRSAGKFDPERGSLPAWLLVIGRNRAISRLRGRPSLEILEEKDGMYANAFVSTENIEDEASRMQVAEILKTALAQLPEEQRRAVELAYFEGMTQTEIAARTGSPLGTVKTRVRTAMHALKKILDDGKARQPGRL